MNTMKLLDYKNLKSSIFAHIFEEISFIMKFSWRILFVCTLFMQSSFAQTMADGIQHLENENFGAALKTFKKLAIANPKDPLPHYYIGEVQYQLDDTKEARLAYEKGLDLSSRCDECHIGLAKLDWEMGKSAEAKKHFDAALKGNSKNAKIQSLVGTAYLYNKNPDASKALEYISKARDLDPKLSSYWIYLGDAYLVSGDLGQAMTSYETAVEKDKNNPETYVKMARIWSSATNYDLAIEKLEEVIRLKPNYAIAYKDLYELYIRNRKFDKVVPILEKYVALTGTDVDAKVRLVKFLCYSAKDYNKAIDEGKKILESHPEQYTVHRWLAWSYFENGEYNNSLENSQKLFLAIDQDTSKRKLFESDLEFAAKASIKLNNMEEAENYFSKLMEMNPSRSTEIYGILAKANYDAKNYPRAEFWYLKKSEKEGLSTTELLYLGLSQKFQQKYPEADTTFSIVLQKSPSYEYGWLQRADINHKMDTAETKLFLAKPYYDKYIELASAAADKNKNNLIEAYIYMVVYFAKNADYQTAKSYCSMVLSLDPEESRAVEYAKILGIHDPPKRK